MAYDGGYQQRPYNGPAAPRPPPQRQYPPGPNGPSQHYNSPPPQQYDQYQDGYDGYDYDDYGGGYGPDYGADYGQYDDMNYQRGPPPQNYPPQQDYYGPGPGPGRGRQMGPGGPGGGRGGPMQRPYAGDGPRGPYPPRGGGPGPGPGPGRGFPPNGPPPGRGPGRPLERSATSDPLANRGRPQMSPQDSGFGGGSPFPAFPGHNKKTDLDQENQILEKMGGMEISAKRPNPPSSQNSQSSQRGGPMGPPGPPGPPGPGPMGPPQRTFTHGGYPEPRRGPGPGSGYGGPADFREPGFGPPMRTMTMPANAEPMGMRGPPPERADPGAYGAPGPRGMPARPSTAQGMRGPPRNMPPPQGGMYQGGGGYDGPGGYDQPAQRPASFDDFYDYYEQPQENGAPSDIPDFDAMSQPQHRSSLDQHMASGPGMQEQRGPGRHPEISRTKSQPDLRQPQAAVFEMVGEVPPIPSQYRPYQPANGAMGPDGPPSGPPGGYGPRSTPGPGLPSNPAPARQGSGASAQSASNPDSLPSHPTPVRPGLMPNSLASQMVNKPPPVRTYTSGTPPVSNNSNPNMMAPPPPLAQNNGNTGPPRPESKVPVTSDELERLRATIKSDPNDQEAALRLAKRLVEAMDVIVPTLPDPRGRAKMRERYAADAHKIFKKLANAQNGEAMFAMADCLGRGVFGAEPDNKEAFTLYQSAAKLGVAAAAYRTAVCCEIGQEEGGGTRKDPAKAVQWYKRAATLGDTPAMYKVGMILLKGLLGSPRNPREAVGWLKRAAERADAENPHALHELGLLYESAQPNDAILRDEPYAFRLFQQAADLGYKFSQFRLGAAFEYGLMGCPIDPRLSIMWYSKAATQEEHQSELALSGWYLTGSENVLAQSDTEAYLWARKAAVAGLAKAEYAMGYFTEIGIGVPANMDDAKRWYWRAAAQDFPKARERLEDLKRTGKNGPRQRERISRSTPKQEGECVVM